MMKLFYQNYAESSDPFSSFRKELGKDEKVALTLHPLKDPPFVYRIHNFLTDQALMVGDDFHLLHKPMTNR